ncbi:CDGSH iron-sulfur domain-containing protein 3, mitochondrial-like [Acanthaster planci]|uniref:CDGSH iron-sulfur domain-containing protein 3, mitochondrial-like n=1 Tax=Acanthaster planci TaxID=133434 RepID=A0A8B7ZX24_ACAPL|nr:CDGSH iron-sulfur domain-containing protein 3, mitochondrial-like [Acanthaster planci]
MLNSCYLLTRTRVLFPKYKRVHLLQDFVTLQQVRHLDVGPKGTYIAKKIPALVKLEPGKKYYWCKCGLSKKQPFCDGAHKPTQFKPVMLTVDVPKRVLLCRCKQTSNEPYCDMTHVKVMFSSFGKRLGLAK